MKPQKKQLSIHFIKPEKVQLIVIDSFCGAGGFTEGVEMAVDADGDRVAVVIVGINHDALAIESHAINHPETTHFVEDIRDRSLPIRILSILDEAKQKYPNAKVLFHASLECTDFSNAKGGKSRNPDSRSLAEYMPWYLEVLKPDLFTIENVREFLSWGPMTAKRGKTEEGYPYSFLNIQKEGKGKKAKVIGYGPLLVPMKEYKALYFNHWVEEIRQLGYPAFEHRLHNTADFGVNQARTRLFGVFATDPSLIAWPRQTHAKKPSPGLMKWRPIRECLNLQVKGTSIFREKPLSDKTYERIFEGLVRHVGNGDREFMSKYFSGSGMNFGLDNPAHTITNVDHHSLVQCQSFVMTYHSGSPENRVKNLEDPAQTLTTENRIALVSAAPFMMQSNGGLDSAKSYPSDRPSRVITTSDNQRAVFCIKYHGKGGSFDGEHPCSTLTLKDRVGVIQTEQFISLYYSQGKQEQSVEYPAAALTTIPKHRLITAQFIDQQYGKSKPSSLDNPSPCVMGNPHCALIHTEFITQRNGGEPDYRNTSLDDPARTLTATGGNLGLVQLEKADAHWLLSNIHDNKGTSLDEPSPTLLTGNHHYVMSTHFSNVGNKLDAPSPTITADRHWAYLVTVEQGLVPAIIVFPTDSLPVRKIKAFMAEYGIVDILMRMLMVQELKLIQGFPSYYILKGSQSHQKKFIGNSIPPKYVKVWIEALARAVAKSELPIQAVA